MKVAITVAGAPVNTTSNPITARPRKRVIAATIVGNWLEFFDFTTFALFAVWIGKTFFPAESPETQLLLAVGVFGAGYLMRPLGALVLGRYADIHGRRAALMATILLMTLGTAVIAFTPSYQSIGVAAPLLIVAARLVQGFSAGGEMGAATSYLIESAPPGKRATRGSWQYASQGLAGLAAALMAYGLSLTLSDQQMATWGWRAPFVFGLLIAPAGLVIRRYMHDDAPIQMENQTKGRFWNLLAGHWDLLFTGVMAICGTAVGASVIGHYMTSYAIHTLKLPAGIGILATAVAGAIIALGALVGGVMADRVGRRPVMIWTRLAFAVLVLPAFWLLDHSRTTFTLLSVVAVLTLFQAISGAVLVVALPECFPRQIRSVSLSLIYAVGVTLFGGTAQIVVTWLLNATDNPASPGWYLVATSLVSLAALLRLHPPRADAAI